MPTIDLVVINEFMDSPFRKTMPLEVLEMVKKGTNIDAEHYSTGKFQITQLSEYSREITDKLVSRILVNFEVPTVRKSGTLMYYVYHHETGRYVGSFRLNTETKPPRP